MRSTASTNRALKATVNTVKAISRMQPQKPAVVAPPQPSDAEVAEYAKWLGLEDPELFWIARLALSTPIPSPWIQCQTDEGDVFFHNTKTKESVWDHPFDSFYKSSIAKFNASEISRSELINLVNEKNPSVIGSSGRLPTSRVSSTLAVNVDTPVKAKTSSSSSSSLSAARKAPSSIPSSSFNASVTASTAAAAAATATATAPPAASQPQPQVVELSESFNEPLSSLPEPAGSGEGGSVSLSSEQSPIGKAGSVSVAESVPDVYADLPTTTVRVELGSGPVAAGTGNAPQVIQSERVGMENLRRELVETKSRVANILGDLKHERARSKELELQLSAARLAAIPATTELPALKTENSKLVEEVLTLKHRLEEANRTVEISQSRLSATEERLMVVRMDAQKRRELATKAANAMIDEDRMTRLKFTAVEEANISLREEVLRLRRILSNVNVHGNGRPKKAGCLGGLCGAGKDLAEGDSRHQAELSSVNMFQMPPPSQPFASRVPEIVAELRVALQATPVASPQSGDGEDAVGNGNFLDFGGNASDYESHPEYSNRSSVRDAAASSRPPGAVFTTSSSRPSSSSKFAPPRRR